MSPISNKEHSTGLQAIQPRIRNLTVSVFLSTDSAMFGGHLGQSLI
jgi:hypothetical protein